MATKVIKFNDGINTYVPVTVASAVQYSYNGGVMSVQDAIGTIVNTVVSSNNSVSDVISDHKNSKDYLSYSPTEGLKLSGTHGAGNVKMVPGTGVSFAYTGGALTISSPNSHAYGSDNQHLSASDGGPNGAIIELDGKGGKVNLEGYYKGDATSTYAHVGISYIDSALKITVSYTDTNTVFTGEADASKTTTATEPSEKNGMIGVIQKVKSTNGTSFDETTYVAVPSKEYVDNYVDDAVNVALTSVLKYKGTLGTGGTITTLPTATSAHVGHVYVVKTAGEYANVDVNIDGTNETTSDKKRLEAGDYVIGTWNGSAYMWSAVNGENQVEDKAATLTVPHTTTESTATTIATVDGTNITLKTKHAAVTYTSAKLNDTAPAHGGDFTVIGNVEVNNGHVTKLHTQKVKLPSETQLSKTGTNKTAKLTHGGTFTYITNLNVSNHAITYDYTTATLPAQGPDYGQIKVAKHSDLATDTISSSDTEVTLSSVNDNELVTFESVNKWLHIKGTNGTTAGSDKIQFSHALSGVSAQNTSDVYSIKIDAAGHITNAAPAATGTVGLTSLKYKVGNDVTDIDDAALGLTFGDALVDIAVLTGDKTFVK